MIDLRSDTVTKPDDRMREAARDAEVGDEVYGQDPTVADLEAAVAERLGFEDALFVPSGTMGNQIAARTHADRGEEALVEQDSHIYLWEVGGLAQLAGLQTRPYDGGERGVPTPEQVREASAPESDHRAGTGLLCLENTHNRCGGVAIAPEKIDAAAEAANDLGIPVHLDGARLFNAAVAHDVPAKRFTREVDSAMVCLSKGLGAPIGSALAGDAAFIEAATRHRKLLGGGMRQVGIVAAPALIALENVDRLTEDHDNARRLAAGLDAVDGLSATEPETNIVLVDTTETGMTAAAFLEACETAGVLGTEFGEYTARFCTHLDVDTAEIEQAIEAIEEIVG